MSAYDLDTALEELTHLQQNQAYQNLKEKFDDQCRLTPEAMLFRTLNIEDIAKVKKVMAMHEIKNNGGQDVWDEELHIEKNSVLGKSMIEYNESVSRNPTPEVKIIAAAKIYQNHMNDYDFRKSYLKHAFGLNNIEQGQEVNYSEYFKKIYSKTNSEDLRDIPLQEIISAGEIPGTDINILAGLEDQIDQSKRYSMQEYHILKHASDAIQGYELKGFKYT